MLRLLRQEDGQGLVEYALIVALISVTLMAALGLMTGGISNIFSDIASALTNAIP